MIEMPIVHPEKRPEWMNSPEKLDGWLDKTTAAEILKKGQNGVVIMAAESMVLIAAMGDLTHELIISDVNLAQIAVLMTEKLKTTQTGLQIWILLVEKNNSISL
ncbi:hypothetical protein REG_1647 [Candidatus Regiella insecticola LSR1]|uniref:Uncharacterized protein n=1 Tax=Candidatus Regiella insecticola LSR1 TaxID=663321 RepID=E0WU77_9ENTR|nr:hypothetical protein REG_1647 [Candidatus Regiella insecticola LSR1]